MGSQQLPRISAGQFATMVTAGYTGLGIFYFPRDAVSFAGRAGVYALWVDGLAAFVLMRLIFRMSRLVPNETFAGFAPELLSKPVGYFVDAFSVVYHIALGASATVLISMVLGNIFLPSTPIWAIDGCLTATGAYMAWGGASGLGRTLQASYLPLLILSTLSISLAATSITHPELLVPSTHVAIVPLLQGAYRQFMIFIGFQASITLYPFIREGDRDRAERYSLYGLLGVVAALTLQYEVIMGVFGPEMISTLRWPLASAYRIISVSGFFISKLGTLLIVLWTIVVAGFISVRLWCVAYDLSSLTRTIRPIPFKWGVVMMAAATFGSALLFPNAKIADLFNERWLVPCGLGYLVITPLGTLTVASLRRKWVLHLKTMTERGREYQSP